MPNDHKDTTENDHRWCSGCGMLLRQMGGLWSCKTTGCPGNLSHLFPPGDDNGPAVVKQCGICTALGHTSDEHAASDNSLPPAEGGGRS